MKPSTPNLDIFLFLLISITLVTIGGIQIYSQYAFGYSSRTNISNELFGKSAQVYGLGFILLGLAPLAYIYGKISNRKNVAIILISLTSITGTLALIFSTYIASAMQ